VEEVQGQTEICSAMSVDDLAILPGNVLEKVKVIDDDVQDPG